MDRTFYCCIQYRKFGKNNSRINSDKQNLSFHYPQNVVHYFIWKQKFIKLTETPLIW